MEVKLTGRHLEITNALRTLVEEKAEKLPRYNNNVDFLEVIIDGSEGGKPSIELITKGGKNKIIVIKEIAESEDTFYPVVDTAFHKMERQLRKLKEKERNPIHSVTQ